MKKKKIEKKKYEKIKEIQKSFAKKKIYRRNIRESQ